ncbi:hypothetical protein FVEG_12627 [Fusarium verticillioides 7600]|uniref:Uncharacterized protein n=1 Tax=Gibberella moniliformis (strain M3125 / FGSC 7600) TaxID=334819 RepID=W7NDP0_GIBM7|nr:hypothetical protein FVEG_12627 [Fusarium verticillioides 7600]EWG54407.1 hypothetical protein FVEG_12627 [Fusarium verticillioides 7600]
MTMPVTIKSLVLSLLLAQAAYGKDHSSHNCCLYTPEGWIPVNDWTEAVCAMRWGSVATFDGVKCIQKPGNVISGDDFYTACKLYGETHGYGPDWAKGAGYRGTCS